MNWNESEIALPGGGWLSLLDNLSPFSQGVLFYLPDPLTDSPDEEELETVARQLEWRALGVATFRWPPLPWPKDQKGEGQGEGKSVQLLDTILEKMRAHYAYLSPFFFCYAKGGAGSLLYACHQAFGPQALDYALQIPLPIKGPAPIFSTTLSVVLGLSIYFSDHTSTFTFSPPSPGIWAYQAYVRAKAHGWSSTLSHLSSPEDWDSDWGEQETNEALYVLAREGCEEGALSLFEAYERYTKREALSLEEAQETLSLLLDLEEKARLLAGSWENTWPLYMLWPAIGARFGSQSCRTLLIENLIICLPELRALLFKSLQRQAREQSYAAILCGVLSEEGLLFGAPDLSLAAAYYQSASALGDPQGDERIGLLLEYDRRFFSVIMKEDREKTDAWERTRAELIPDPYFYYERAANAFFLPAMLRLAWRWEQEEPNFVLSREASEITNTALDPSRQVETGVLEAKRDEQKLEELYEKILEQKTIRWCTLSLSQCRIRLGDLSGAIEALEEAAYLDENRDELLEEEYTCQMGIDRVAWCVMPPARPLSSGIVHARLGNLLYGQPDPRYSDEFPLTHHLYIALQDILDFLNDLEEEGMDTWEKKRELSKVAPTDPDQKKALLHYGLCLFHARQCKRNVRLARLCLEMAYLCGEEEAGVYVAFWEEAQKLLEEALSFYAQQKEEKALKEAEEKEGKGEEPKGEGGEEETEEEDDDDCDDDRDDEPSPQEQKIRALCFQEAVLRLRFLSLLGLSPEAAELFERERRLCVCGDVPYGTAPLFPLDEEEPLRASLREAICREIERVERRLGALVYLVQIQETFTALYVSLFYVSGEIQEWEFDRSQLSQLEPFVYSWNALEKRFTGEIGPIGLELDEDGLARIW